MAGWLYDDAPNGILHFVLLTLILGGAGAMASGRSVAATWKSFAIVPVYMLVLAAVIRFLQYALFQGDLLSIPGFVVAFIVTLVASAYGYRVRRSYQMVTQYSWIYAKSGPLGWVPKRE